MLTSFSEVQTGDGQTDQPPRAMGRCSALPLSSGSATQRARTCTGGGYRAVPRKAGGEHDWHRGTGEGTDAFCRLSWPLDTTQSKL